MLQSCIPFLPEGAQIINTHVALYRHDGQVEFYTASGPIFSCAENDRYGLRLAQGILIKETSVTPAQLAKALKINRSTVYRNSKTYTQAGAAGLLIDKGNREAYKLKGEKLKKVQTLLNQGCSINAAAKKVDVSIGCIRYAIRKGTIKRKSRLRPSTEKAAAATRTSQRSAEDSVCTLGIGTKREAERLLASQGKLDDAAPAFCANESVRHAGVLLALPALASLGFIEAGTAVYGKLKQGFYGLHSILLTLAFMALLRIKTPEQLKGGAPGELGIILGLDRAPEVKTLRQKINEMGLRNKAGDFMAFLTQRWADQDQDILGFVYIDGHVRPYNGRKHKLPKTHVARRRLCMPATTDFWVNDANCEPLFFITAEANNSLLSMLDKEVIPELKGLAGKGNRVTLVFDREGWSPKSFEKWFKADIDVITYRKGNYDPWPSECFIEVNSHVRDKAVTYLLGERSIRVRKNFWMREIRRLCDDGHQTSIMTTRHDLDFEQIALRMFSRWNQENFFRYMREEFALDHLVTNNVEPADIERMVPNPEKKEKKKAIATLKRELVKLKTEYAGKAVANDESRRPTMRGFNIANPGMKKQISGFEKEIEKAEAELKQVPAKVAVKQVLESNQIVRLETERKMLTDTVKMACYRAESALFNLLGPHFARNNDEGRSFLKSVFQQTADILPDEDRNILTVKFHTMANPRSNRSLRKLCDIVNETDYVFPGTALKLLFEAPGVAFEVDRGQEP
jgi:hypothetical protein